MEIDARHRMAFLLALFLPFGAAASPPTAPDSAAEIAFQDIGGGARALSELRGGPVLLDFWASWCAPCRKGFPFLNALQAKHAAAGLKVVGLTLEEDDDAVRAFLAAVPATFLVGRDPSGRAGEVFEVAVMPTSFLLDRDGHVVARFEGGTETVHREIETAIAELLAGRPLAATAESKNPDAGKSSVRAWERGYLADPIMSLDGDVLGRIIKEHIHASKEAAAGDGGVAGGGCGCN